MGTDENNSIADLILGKETEQALKDLAAFEDYNNKELKKINENLSEINESLKQLVLIKEKKVSKEKKSLRNIQMLNDTEKDFE